MCNPLVALAVSTAISLAASKAAANAQKKSIEANHEQQQEASLEQQRQINAESANEQQQRAIQGNVERGRMRVAAGEAGVGGLTTQRLLSDSYFQEASDIAVIEGNRGNSAAQSQLKAKSNRAENQSGLNIAQAKFNESAGQSVGGLVGSAAAAYSNKIKIPKNKAQNS